MSIDFVALDVETANSRRGSVCAIGLALVEAGRIAHTYSWLCRPPRSIGHFDGFNVALHGITAAQVAGEPEFGERLRDALDVIGNRPVVAHNAAFDVGAVRDACDADGRSWPALRYGCTLVWARRELDLVSYRLPLVARELGVVLDRHHAAAGDAKACAEIMLTLVRRRGVATIDDFAAVTGTRVGSLTPDSWGGCCVTGNGGGLIAPDVNADADPAHPLYGRSVVFTGALSIRRQEAWEIVASFGGTPENGVNRRTTFLVIGDGFVGDDPAEFHTGKASKAMRARMRGQRIEVLTESDFFLMTADRSTSGTRRGAALVV